MFLNRKHSLRINPLAVTSAKFLRVARVITDRVAELLHAQVLIVDLQGVIVTSSEPQQVGLPFEQISRESIKYLRVPLHLDAQVGEVVVGEPLNGEVISPRLSQVIVELVINQTNVLDRLPNQQELKNQFIYNLLHGQIVDEALILHQAKLLEMDLRPPRAVILIDATDYVLAASENEYEVAQHKHRRTQLIVGSVVNFFHLPDDTICADLGEGEIAVLKASDTKNLGSWADDQVTAEASGSSSWANLTALKRASDALLLRLSSDTGTPISIGIGRYHPGGIRGLARSYQDARAALSLGRRFDGHNRVHCLDRLGIAAFACVADERTKIDLARYLLSPLDYEPELLLTLEVFFAQDCCPSSTAKLLSIHRNTLSYRLDKLTSLIGLDPRRFDDAVQIRLALLLRKL